MAVIDIVFWSCLFLGGIYTLAMLAMGTVGHGGGGHHGAHFHADAGVHHGDLGGHHAAHGVDAHGGHAGHDGAHAHGDHGAHHEHAGEAANEDGFSAARLLQYLNPMSVACFLAGFGGAGVMMRMMHNGPAVSLLVALASGTSVYWLISLLLVRLFGMAGGSSHTVSADMVGLSARVTAPISGTQPGMISCTVRGARQSLRAIADEGESIPMGAPVRIRRVTDQIAHVMPVEVSETQRLLR